MNFISLNDWHWHLPNCWPFPKNHPVYMCFMWISEKTAIIS
jgi:hypothetical protein